MKTFRLFATVLMVAMCAMVVTSCSDDDDDNKEVNLIVGKWKPLDEGHKNDVLEFKSNGVFTFHYSDYEYSEDGNYKIESGKLSMLWLEDDEPDWTVYKINVLNSTSLKIQEYDTDGTLSEWTESYQRMN